MGAWGPAIFHDDDAVDVRDGFKHYVADTQDIAAATDAAVLDNGASFETPQDHTAFWLGLALTQHRAGWLDPRVKAVALSVIDDGSDLAKWSDPADAKKRARALTAARAILDSEARLPSPFPKPWPTQFADLKTGEVIGRELPNGRLAVMKVVGFYRTTKLKVRGPGVRLQHWLKTTMPTQEEAQTLERIRYPVSASKIQTFDILVLTGPRDAPLDRGMFLRPGIIAPTTQNESRGAWSSITQRATFTPDEVLAAGIDRFWNDPTLPANAYAPWYKPGGRIAPA
jgi:Domain of unknown function (DUF4259)